jgi:hypothetical protein
MSRHSKYDAVLTRVDAERDPTAHVKHRGERAGEFECLSLVMSNDIILCPAVVEAVW